MNTINKKEDKLFKKCAEMMWVLHRYHRENHNKFEKTKDNHEKQAERRILAMLKLQEEMDKEELMFILGIPKYHFDKVLEKMEKSEFILSSEENGSFTVKITEKGKSEEEKEEKSEFESIFDCLSDEEKVNFGQYIDAVVSSVKPKLNDDTSEPFNDFHRGNFHERHSGGQGMDRNFGRCGEGHDSHRSFNFFEKPDMEDERPVRGHEFHKHPHFHKDREFGGFDRRPGMENERCREGHGPHRHFHSHREKDFREFMENFHRFYASDQRRRDSFERESRCEYPEKFDFINYRRK